MPLGQFNIQNPLGNQNAAAPVADFGLVQTQMPNMSPTNNFATQTQGAAAGAAAATEPIVVPPTENTNKTMEFLKTHKTKIIIAVVLIAAAAGAYYYFKNN